MSPHQPPLSPPPHYHFQRSGYAPGRLNNQVKDQEKQNRINMINHVGHKILKVKELKDHKDREICSCYKFCQEEQSERTSRFLPFLPDFFPLSLFFPLFFLIFSKYFTVRGGTLPPPLPSHWAGYATVLWGNVFLGEELQFDAKNTDTNFEIFERALYMTSGSRWFIMVIFWFRLP